MKVGFNNFITGIKIAAVDLQLKLLGLVDIIAGLIKRFFDYWKGVVDNLIQKAPQFMFSQRELQGIKNYQKDNEKVAEFFGQDFTSNKRAELEERAARQYEAAGRHSDIHRLFDQKLD